MNAILKKIRNRFFITKAYITRATTYLTIINAGMIFFLFLSRIKDLGYVETDLQYSYPIIFIATLVGLYLFGFFDINYLKGMDNEQAFYWTKNLEWNSFRKEFTELKEEVKRLKHESK